MMVIPALEPRLKAVLLSLLILASVTMIVFGQMPGDSLLWGELQNTAHTVVFAAVTLAFMGVLRQVLQCRCYRSAAAYAVGFFVLTTVAVLTEFGQLLTQREPSPTDVVRNIAGILIGLGVFASVDPYTFTNQLGGRVRAGIVVCSVFLFVASLFPLTNLAIAYVKRDQAFPMIIDFEASWSRPFLKLNHAVVKTGDGPENLHTGKESSAGKATFLNLRSGDYPGFAVVEPYPDWSAYRVLHLELYSTHGSVVSVVLRIHDERHNQEYIDRFNRVLRLEPGHNSFRVPLREVQQGPANRELNLQHVSGVELFALKFDGSLDLYPGAVTLR